MTRWAIYKLGCGYHGCKPIPAGTHRVEVKGTLVELIEGTQEQAIARCAELERKEKE